MKLHTASAVPDWETVAPARRNYWQQLAARTGGIISPGNIVSGVGLVMTAIGCYWVYTGMPIAGLAIIAVGRLADIADGWLAESTGTKSPLGEKVDAGFDKLATFGAIATLVSSRDMSDTIAFCIIIVTLVTVTVSLIASARKRPVHPSRSGKLSMVTLWIALGLYILANGGQPILAYAHAATILCLTLVAIATYGYAKRAFSS